MSKKPNSNSKKNKRMYNMSTLIDIGNINVIELKLMSFDYSKSDYNRIKGSINIGNLMSINVDFVYNSKNDNYFISLPTYKTKNDEYKNLVFIWDSNLFNKLNKTANELIDAFFEEID